MDFKNINKINRLKGAISEAEFVVQAMKKNFKVSKPFTEDCRYDFIIDNGKNLTKIQVKSCSASTNRGYNRVELRRKRNKTAKYYTKKDIDIFAIHIVEKNIWYLIPVENIPKNGVIHMSEDGKYEVFRNNWHWY